jgi:hypothetical protein
MLIAERANGPVPRRNGVSHVWSRSGRVGANASGRADHQSRDRNQRCRKLHEQAFS